MHIRVVDQLWSPEMVGREAAEKTVARLNPRKCQTSEAPVLFIPETASGLLSSFIGAISGGSLLAIQLSCGSPRYRCISELGITV